MATLEGIEPEIKPLSAEELENLTRTSIEENALVGGVMDTSQPESAIPVIKISNTHRKLLERLQPNRTGRLKIIQKPKTELIPIWERRGQTEDQYFKRSK